MKLSHHQQFFSQDIAKLILKANLLGIHLTFGEAYRTEDQQQLYYHGKTICNNNDIITIINDRKRSKTMKSNHLRRLAVDFNFFINGELTYTHPLLEVLGKFWESLSPLNRWGGHFKNFNDAPHFERNA